ncbi:hypothetical protein GCM10027443_28300 [Pontibacter brevis]
MKTIQHIIFLCLLICSTFQATAQPNFKEGFTISYSNDTTFGYIDYRDNLVCAKECNFKKSLESNMASFTPNQMKAYGFLNDKFHQAETITEKNGDGLTMFLEVLVQGRVSLYYYQGRFFARRFNEPLVELRSEKQVVTVGGRQYEGSPTTTCLYYHR